MTFSVSREATKALIPALEVVATLLVIFAYAWLFLDVVKTGTFIILVTLLAIALIGSTVYQAIRIREEKVSSVLSITPGPNAYSEELFKQLYQRSPVPYLMIDTKGAITSLNTASIRLFGREEDELRTVKFFDLVGNNDEGQLAILTEYFRTGVSVNNEELVVMHKDGEPRYVLLSLFPFTNIPHMKGGILTLIDITKQKEIDRAKTEFVSLASHQLRTPLSGMKWHIELFRAAGEEGLTPGQSEYMNKLEEGVIRMEVLINDFLSVSRLELGTLTPHMEQVDLGAFLTNLLSEHEGKAQARQITLERDWDEGAAFVTDTHLLTMSVGNLVSNAVKYTREGGTVRVHSHTDGVHRVIAVSDTGIGIPEHEQAKIFSKIFRASNAKETIEEGTGLGLYIAREAVRVMGGDITFVSVQNEGTTFTVVLPE
jgi:PAS domain S-box-containing protein